MSFSVSSTGLRMLVSEIGRKKNWKKVQENVILESLVS